MKKAVGIIVIMALVIIALVTFVNKQMDKDTEIEQVGKEVGIKKGQTAPDFTMATLDGKEVTLSKLKGKKVVLNFWATWCPPCKEEMPHLQKYYEKKAKDDNVEIVAVNLTYFNQTEEQVQQFVDSHKITFPTPLMKDSKIGDKYEVLTIPSTFFIDTEGKIQHQVLGPLDENTLEDYIAKLN